MRAMLLLVLLLVLMALFSFHEPIAPYWKSRFPAVMSCLDEGRYGDALAAAIAGDAPGVKSTRWAKSEPLGEAPPAEEGVPGEGIALAEEAVPGGDTAPEKKLTPVDAARPVGAAVSDM